MKKSSKKISGSLLILAALTIIIGSLAFFSDYRDNEIPANLGSFGIETTQLKGTSGEDELNVTDFENLKPGDSVEFRLEIKNEGSLAAELRNIYELEIDTTDSNLKEALEDDGTSLIKLQILEEGGDYVDLVDKWNNEIIKSYANSLVANETITEQFKLTLEENIKNAAQEADFKIKIRTEAKQEDSDNWDEFSLETNNSTP